MLFPFKTKVYCKKLGPDFGRWCHTTILANNLQEATGLAAESFANYCKKMGETHKNEFNYTDIILE